MTLQGGDCNFNLRTLGILNLLARWGPLGGAGLEFGIWELAVPAKVASLQGPRERWGPESELGIWEFRVCEERWGPELELGQIWEFRVCEERWGA